MKMTGSKLLHNPQMRFAAITFFARKHKSDTCGSNGLPLTPNSIIITGKAQILKTISNPCLCEYLDIIRGKHERTVIVSQYSGQPLSEHIDPQNAIEFENVVKIAHQILTGLDSLHKIGIVHRNLCLDNVLVQNNVTFDIKLFNYGLYFMTGNGSLITFPILQTIYAAPEIYLAGPLSDRSSNNKVDIWSLGIILAELVLNRRLWSTLKLGQKIRKLLSLLQCNTAIFEKIAREHNCYEAYLEVPPDLRNLIELCLTISPIERPTCEDLLKQPIFTSYNDTSSCVANKNHFDVFTIHEFYYWWQLAGGDVFQELKKQGLIRSSPPILSLPSLVLIDGQLLGQDRNPATLYDPRVIEMPLDSLYQRFEHIPITSYYPLIHCGSDIIDSSEKNKSNTHYNATDLPLVIKERDPEYQFHRVILLRRLLHGYPYTKDQILRESEKDIPPLLRGNIWSALLNVKSGYDREYLLIDKYTPTATDRQIEVDIPRCHQYNELLSSAEGHKKLKRILKAWVYKNSQYVYWQGLDSLSAPFLYLNFNDEAKAFACLSAFVPKYLHKFFLKDNSVVIEEYLTKFSQLIAFHDAKLSNHLYEINFYPQLFAIPWFLTLFSHVFPLYKILHLWDKLLLKDSSFPLHIGLSILTQLRERLLSSGFNDCILLFSDLPEVDIEKCLHYSMATYDSTPRSVTCRNHENEMYHIKGDLDIMEVPLDDLKKERFSRISANDVVDLVRNNNDHILIIDIRNPTMFARCSISGSINIPFTSVSYNENHLENVGTYAELIRNSNDKNVIVVGDRDTDLSLFPKFLLECDVNKVCVLHGGFEKLLCIRPSILVFQNM